MSFYLLKCLAMKEVTRVEILPIQIHFQLLLNPFLGITSNWIYKYFLYIVAIKPIAQIWMG